MKFIIPILNAFAVIASTAAASAEAASSQFTCTYKPGNRPDVPAQTITYQAPEGVDLSNPNAGGPFEPKTISLYVNGSSEPSTFNVKKRTTRFSHEVVYSQRGQVFISDIAIRYYQDAHGITSFKGTWTVDYPPVLDMDCKFGGDARSTSFRYKRYVIVNGVCWDDKAWNEVAMSYCKRN